MATIIYSFLSGFNGAERTLGYFVYIIGLFVVDLVFNSLFVLILIVPYLFYIYYLLYQQFRILMANMEPGGLTEFFYKGDVKVETVFNISKTLIFPVIVALTNIIFGLGPALISAVVAVALIIYLNTFSEGKGKLRRSIEVYFIVSSCFLILYVAGFTQVLVSGTSMSFFDALTASSFFAILPLILIDLYSVYMLSVVNEHPNLAEYVIRVHTMFIAFVIFAGFFSSDIPMIMSALLNQEYGSLRIWSLRTPVYLTVMMAVIASREVSFLKFMRRTNENKILESSREKIRSYDIFF